MRRIQVCFIVLLFAFPAFASDAEQPTRFQIELALKTKGFRLPPAFNVLMKEFTEWQDHSAAVEARDAHWMENVYFLKLQAARIIEDLNDMRTRMGKLRSKEARTDPYFTGWRYHEDLKDRKLKHENLTWIWIRLAEIFPHPGTSKSARISTYETKTMTQFGPKSLSDLSVFLPREGQLLSSELRWIWNHSGNLLRAPGEDFSGDEQLQSIHCPDHPTANEIAELGKNQKAILKIELDAKITDRIENWLKIENDSRSDSRLPAWILGKLDDAIEPWTLNRTSTYLIRTQYKDRMVDARVQSSLIEENIARCFEARVAIEEEKSFWNTLFRW